MAAKRHTAKPRANGTTPEGRVVLPEKVVRKLKPELLRVLVAMAMEDCIQKIAEDEGITIDGVQKRLERVRKLVDKKTSIGALYILMLAGVIPIK